MDTIEYRNHTIKINYDENATNPREDDQLGTIICWGKYSYLGDDKDTPKNCTLQEYKDELESAEHEIVAHPIYLYDHSGITIRTTPFSCPWDSGQIGYIVMNERFVQREFNGDRERAGKCLDAEIEEYNAYLTGDVYGYEIVGKRESCWGYYGREYCIEEAKRTVDYLIHRAELETQTAS